MSGCENVCVCVRKSEYWSIDTVSKWKWKNKTELIFCFQIFRKCSTAAVAAAAAANAAASVDDDYQSFRNNPKQHNQNATRGKSLSPTKVCSIKKQLVGSNGSTLNRSTSSRQIALRKHKLALLKAKQQSIKTTTSMGVPVDSAQPKDAAIASANKSNAKCEPSDESEYSSLEDDDDIQGKCNKRWSFCLLFNTLCLLLQVTTTAKMIIRWPSLKTISIWIRNYRQNKWTVCCRQKIILSKLRAPIVFGDEVQKMHR